MNGRYGRVGGFRPGAGWGRPGIGWGRPGFGWGFGAPFLTGVVVGSAVRPNYGYPYPYYPPYYPPYYYY